MTRVTTTNRVIVCASPRDNTPVMGVKLTDNGSQAGDICDAIPMGSGWHRDPIPMPSLADPQLGGGAGWGSHQPNPGPRTAAKDPEGKSVGLNCAPRCGSIARRACLSADLVGTPDSYTLTFGTGRSSPAAPEAITTPSLLVQPYVLWRCGSSFSVDPGTRFLTRMSSNHWPERYFRSIPVSSAMTSSAPGAADSSSSASPVGITRASSAFFTSACTTGSR